MKDLNESILLQDEEHENKGKDESCEAAESGASEREDATDEEENEMENEAELTKSLNKQRRHAIAATRRGRKSHASRNSYKDKGGRSSHNSKLQKQLSGW